MKPRHWLLILLATLLSACGDDGSPTGPGPDPDPNDDPTPTAVGTPNGAPSSATIGSAGGDLASSDALFTVSIPAGALAADTEIGVQPITNLAWGGQGKAYRLTPDGLTFAAPVELVFALDPSLLTGSDPAFADVAVQRDDGVWGVLKNREVDATAGTLTCTTTHFSDYSMTEGVQIVPASAVVDVNGNVALSVLFCSREVIDGDPDLASLLISCDDDLAPLGTFENWSVNGIPGGNGTVGTVSPTSGHQVGYHAPAVAPTPNVVAVSVETTFEGRAALLVCNIRITGEERWVGSFTDFQGSSGDKSVATLVWEQTGTFGTIKFFEPSGSMLYTITSSSDCAFVSLTPNTDITSPTDGVLLVDYATDPPTFSGGLGQAWDATHCYQCPDHPVQCADIPLGGGWGAKGDVHDSGTRIDGIILDTDDNPIVVFNFVKELVP